MDRFGGPMTCPRCEKLIPAATVRTNIWQGERLIVVEDIPAHLCDMCGEQYYHPLVSETLRAMLDDLASVTPKRVIEVPVYSLEGRIPEIPTPAEGEEEEEPEEY